jgi:SAM-dependent methyltransferase
MPDHTEAFAYSGNELETFAVAVNWKAYWSSQIDPYLGQDVLELGAGLGATARALNHRRYRQWLGLEPDKGMCAVVQAQQAQGQLPAVYQIRNGTSLDLAPAELFDTILYIDVLEHIEHDREELERVSAHLVPGGHIVIVAPAHNFLFTDFDKKIGHHRRYDKALLRAAVPAALRIKKLHYLDSVGMLASLANRLVLKSDTPKLSQIRLWDSVMVRASRWIDPLTGHRLGKSIVCILEKPPLSESSAR